METPNTTVVVPRHRDDLLCDTNETQVLLDNFFALYASSDQQQQNAPAALHAARRGHGRTTADADEGEADVAMNPPRVVGEQRTDPSVLGGRVDEASSPGSADGEEEEEGDDDEQPVGRTDGHHAQQSQYVPEDGEEEMEDEGEEVQLDRQREAMVGPDDDDDDAAPPEIADGSASSAAAPPDPPATATTALPASPARSDSSAVQAPVPDFMSSSKLIFWPFAQPPETPTALPTPTQTRAAFHTSRYGAFIKAYLGLSDAAVRQAERRGRGICMIGVRRVPKYGKGVSAASPISYSFGSPRQMPTCKGIPTGTESNHPFRYVRPSNADPVRTQRVFLRHSVLAVEGDAVFCQLIDRAEMLYAVEQQRLDSAVAAYAARHESQSGDQAAAAAVEEKEEEGKQRKSAPALDKDHQRGGDRRDKHEQHVEAVMYPQFRKLPRVSEPYLRPNARCIALHYGLPDRKSGKTEENSNSNSSSSGASPFPRATLIAVVSTTRLEENAEIYISLDSYYRCLDEVSWYRRCYRQLNARYGCSTFLGASSSSSPTTTPTATATTGVEEISNTGGGNGGGDGDGDIYSGVKRFTAWPAKLAFYHGVGRRHASSAAEAAFPFTLVELGAAPELGEGQKGVVASSWLPYGTCLLYCGPSVATRKVEKLVTTARLGSGHAHSHDSPKPTEARRSLKGLESAMTHWSSKGLHDATQPGDAVKPQQYGGEEEEDLSFVVDDTYALGLGRHGVCFGQGLTRYINHRYNTSRFGNVELCSVMLSVPSEFGAGAAGEDGQRSFVTSAFPPPPPQQQQQQQQQQKDARKAATTLAAANLPSDPSLTEEENHQIRAIAKKQYGRNSGGGGAAADGHNRGKRRAQHRHRAPRFFLEEKSFFVTVPFFLVTTDIPPGAPLLAWTYGEDYDAKLERQAVADGHVVPYADAVVLNRRLAPPSPCPLPSRTAAPLMRRRFQRYTGDYRFAVGVGDVVWRRRPLLPPAYYHSSANSADAVAAAVACTCGGASQASRLCTCVERLIPPPEEDLFVVVQTQRGSVERVLLQPLVRVDLTDAALDVLLSEQHLREYVSPHASYVAFLAPARRKEDGDEALKRQLERQTRKGKKKGGNRGVGGANTELQHKQASAIKAPTWSQHWAVFQLPMNAVAGAATAVPLTRAEEALRRCVVATMDTVGLLQPDIDYSFVYAPRADTNGSSSSNNPRSSGGGGGGAAAVAARATLDATRRIVVNLDDLRYATRLVRTAADRATAVPALMNGLLWPLFSAQVERGGGPASSTGGNTAPPVSRRL